MFDSTTIDQLATRFKEPAWLTDLRRAAWAKHGELPWPHASDDIWRRTDVSLLDPSKGFVPAEPALQQSVPLTDERLAELTNRWAARRWLCASTARGCMSLACLG